VTIGRFEGRVSKRGNPIERQLFLRERIQKMEATTRSLEGVEGKGNSTRGSPREIRKNHEERDYYQDKRYQDVQTVDRR